LYDPANKQKQYKNPLRKNIQLSMEIGINESTMAR